MPPRSRGAAVPASAHWPSPLALVVETSGSSGAPRAAMLTLGNLLTAAALSNAHLGFAPGDCWLCCLPLRHIGGLSITYRCALAGATLLLHPGFDAAAVAADLAPRAVTHLSLVPPMLARLLALGRPPPPSLRVVLVGGQSLSAPLARQAIAAGWPLACDLWDDRDGNPDRHLGSTWRKRQSPARSANPWPVWNWTARRARLDRAACGYAVRWSWPGTPIPRGGRVWDWKTAGSRPPISPAGDWTACCTSSAGPMRCWSPAG